MIELRNVSKVYQQKKRRIEAVKEVSLTIQQGEIFGVVGYSGAGKSTLIRMINFLEPPTTGQILINDQDLGELNKKELLLNHLLFQIAKMNQQSLNCFSVQSLQSTDISCM